RLQLSRIPIRCAPCHDSNLPTFGVSGLPGAVQKVKTSPFAKQIADMQVNNMQRPQTDAERSVQADFALNTFAGVAGTSEAAWKTSAERGRR
ncbi:hypothetical protein, partial [Tsukamurella sp. NPDC003166]|uniref:hypothetical protein n=1 Tax=Tsukamurella sp. NPDC003166 TaxID=3154444 RepID=UPI0033B8003F